MLRPHVVLLWMLAGYLLVLAAQSLSWPMYQDTPIMLYAAWLIDRFHAVPYRDFFDNQMPGTYAANLVVGWLSGYTERGVRGVDLSLLAVLLTTTVGAMRRFGSVVAAGAAIFFGVLYLASGEWMSLQREYLLLLPLSAALWVALARVVRPVVRAAAVGLLLGLVATIKPHAALAWPALLWFVWRDAHLADARDRQDGRSHRPAGPGLALLAWSTVAFAMPLVATAAYLWRHGALGAFIDGAVNYWPLYGALSGSPRPHVILTGADRAWYVVRHAIGFGGHPGFPLAVAAAIGLHRATTVLDATDRQRHVVWLLVALAAASWVATAVAGKFYLYHWLPLNYFCILLASLGFMARPAASGPAAPRRDQLLLGALVVSLCVGLPWRYGPFYRPFAFPFTRVQEIASVLSERLEPGDTVAPLDWTEGAVHAMLLARAPLGVPFLYDFHFYHHVSSPYVQGLRQRLLARIERTPPRFIVRVPQVAFAGRDTASDFSALMTVVEARYTKVVEGRGYEIWQRRAP